MLRQTGCRSGGRIRIEARLSSGLANSTAARHAPAGGIGHLVTARPLGYATEWITVSPARCAGIDDRAIRLGWSRRPSMLCSPLGYLRRREIFT